MQNLILKSTIHYLTPAQFGTTKTQILILSNSNDLSINLQKITKRAFAKENVDNKALIFDQTVFNILSYFIPCEIIICNGKDPLWFNKKLKSLKWISQ